MEHFFVCVRYLHLNSDFFLDIQICNVKPIPEPNPIVLASDIPEKISRFYHYNDVKRFQCDRPVHKGIIDKENEFKVRLNPHFEIAKFTV